MRRSGLVACDILVTPALHVAASGVCAVERIQVLTTLSLFIRSFASTAVRKTLMCRLLLLTEMACVMHGVCQGLVTVFLRAHGQSGQMQFCWIEMVRGLVQHGYVAEASLDYLAAW